MNRHKQQVAPNNSRTKGDIKFMHHLEIGIKRPDSKQLLSAKKLTLRDRLLNTIFGKGHRMVVLLPGESIGTISITEIAKAKSNKEEK